MTTLTNTAPFPDSASHFSIEPVYAAVAMRIRAAHGKWIAYVTDRAIRKHFKDLDDYLIRDIGLEPSQVRMPRSETRASLRMLF